MLDTQRIKVLYVIGAGRSGSTLLDRLLGQLDTCASVGEFRYVWERGFEQNQRCGCGDRFRDCGFWQDVTREALDGHHETDVQAIISLKYRVDRLRYLPRLLLHLPFDRYQADLREYVALVGGMYRAIASVSGANVIIDSSKDVSSAFLLSEVPHVEPYFVHLVRDSRAVAFSWQRRRRRPEIPDREVYMPVLSPERVALELLYRSLFAELLRLRSKNYMQLRYEDLVRTPREALGRLMGFIGEEVEVDFLNGRTARLDTVNHTVSGNPVRFEQGEIEIRMDTEWKHRMKRSQRLWTTVLTLWYLLRYRYL